MQDEMTFNDFVVLTARDFEITSGSRFGQFVFNKLSEYRPEIASLICGTSLDPFYQNKVSTQTWRCIAEQWEK